MIKNQNIICISSIDWDFIWQQHQTIVSALAKNGNRVLFIENTGVRMPTISDMPRIKKRIFNWFKSIKGFRKQMDNLYTYSPLILPFPYLRIARWINRYLLLSSLERWMKVMDFYDPIIWTFLPTPIVLDLVDGISHKAFVYYCTDNFSATSKAAKKIIKYEKKVLNKADAVFVMAESLVEYCSKFNDNVICIPMGIDIESFFVKNQDDKRPLEIEGFNNRIIGYIGGIRNSIDQELIIYLAKNLTDFTFVFVGPLQTDITPLRQFKNIIFIDQKLHTELSKYIRYFDVCIIPYKKNDYTNNISPAKLNEYLIMGKPIVSTKLKEIKIFNQENNNVLYIADDYQNFAELLIEAIKQDNDLLKNKRIEIARNNSWDKKIEEMCEVIEAVIKRKEENILLNWQEKLVEIYKVLRRRMVRIIFTLSIILLLVFYTPLIWFLASPLKIANSPQKADCIVVFAGGVGESGKAGQGYEERVQYAVELYKKGYAKKMIFSSGYMRIFKEPLLMEALAVSLGVPKEAIILEDKARNTYENVKFTKKILDKNNWHDILLISSPYHMRRVRLIYDKVASDIDVIYLPLLKSVFYQHLERFLSKRITLEQIRGIIHEYLGILYYRLKGWI